MGSGGGKRLLTHLIRSKGVANLVRRAATIVTRTGFGAGRMQTSLLGFAELLSRYDAHATFPVTAAALQRHPEVMRQLLPHTPAVELAVHSHRHVDLSLLSESELADEIKRAMTVFRAHGIPFSGFRAPYLRWNDHLPAVLQSQGFWYDSSQCVLWPVVDECGLNPAESASVQLLCDFCQPSLAEAHASLPVWLGDLLEIPVSLPDDEMLVERMGLKDEDSIARIWIDMLEQCHEREELLVLQLHPERFPVCSGALERLLQRARGLRPAVWLANLREVTLWWRARRSLQMDIVSHGENRWEVTARGPADGVLLVRDAEVEGQTAPWSRRYQMVPDRHFFLTAGSGPCVGISPAASLEVVQFLTHQGYSVEVSSHPDEHGVYLDTDLSSKDDAAPLLTEIETSSGPLVRWARWPHGAGAALAISGDVDALTAWDYALRPLEGRT